MLTLREGGRRSPRSLIYFFWAISFHNVFPDDLYGQPVSFVSARPYTTDPDPVSVALGDFNQDGNQDLVSANDLSNSVSVLLGKGNGSFQTAINFPAGSRPQSVVVAYLNGDNIRDLAVANLAGNVSVLLGNRDGTFRSAMSFPAGGAAYGLVDGDFDGDHFQDLAVAGNGPIALLRGNGDGTFQTPIMTGISVQRLEGVKVVILGDYFNHDGILDLVLVYRATPTIRGGGVLFLGRGDGTFLPQALPVDFLAGSIGVGYFNNDVFPDLAVGYGLAESGLTILLNNGDGSFSSGGAALGSEDHRSIAVSDFNGDGLADLAVSHAAGEVSVLLGDGQGGFRKMYVSSSVLSPQALVAGEFNGDGFKDVAVISRPDTVRVLLGWGDGSFQATWDYELGPGWGPTNDGTFRTTVAVGEFNRDGIEDLAVIRSYALSLVGRDRSKVSVLLGNGDGSFRFGVEFETGLGRSIAVGDFNGDRIQDIVVPTTLEITMFLGNGNGTFQPALNSPPAGHFLVVGYFNGDGFQDLAVLNSLTSKVSVQLGQGNGTFQAPVEFDMGVPPASSVEVGSLVADDFNRDGLLDIVATNGSAESASVLLGKGDGTLRAPLIIGTGASSIAVAVGDFNNDKIVDLTVANTSPANVSVLLGKGNGTFSAPLTIGVDSQPRSVVVADFNWDGIQDLGVGGFLGIRDTGRVSVLLGNGNGTFQTAENFPSTLPYFLAAGDFNSDGRPDIAAVGSPRFFEGFALHALSILINNTP